MSEPTNCESCRYPALTTVYEMGVPARPVSLCRLCAATMTGTYSVNGSRDAEIHRTVCFVGNEIKAMLRRVLPWNPAAVVKSVKGHDGECPGCCEGMRQDILEALEAARLTQMKHLDSQDHPEVPRP